MSITTYAELKTAVQNWLKRSDLTSLIPDFITLCEADFNRRLRIRAMETESLSAMTTAQGVTTAALPTGWLQGRVVWLNGTDPRQELQYVTPQQFWKMTGQTETRQPKSFTITGENASFSPIPDAAYAVAATFYKRLDALSDTTTTNWMLTNAPDVYLFGTLKHAMPYIRNDARMPLWDAQYQRAVMDVEMADAKDRHSGGPLVMRTDTGNP